MSRKRSRLKLETKHEPVLPTQPFIMRLLKYFSAATLLIFASLFAGMLGYRYLESMEWIDAFANSAMILSGMGPLTPMQTWGGKLFAGIFALYSGLLLILTSGLLLAPVVHRMLHRFHVDVKDSN